MIRNHSRALGAAYLALGASSIAGAQGYPIYCDDPTTSNTIWSADWSALGVGNDIFGGGLGVSGTVFYETCFAGGFTGQAAGGFHFFVPGGGSVQTGMDNETFLMWGSGYFPSFESNVFLPSGARANWTYAATVRQNTGEAPNLVKFGSQGLDTAIIGASDRYVRFASTQDNIRVELRMDVIGDACRVQWDLTNQGALTNVGLWFGQHVSPGKNFQTQPLPITFINIPGAKPLNLMRRFTRNNNPAASPREYPLPGSVDFMHTQANAHVGLKIINDATPADGPFPDQTNVDSLDIGIANGPSPWLLGVWGGNDAVFPDIFFDDVTIESNVGYIQKWNPRPVQASDRPVSERRVQIVSYYKSTWGDSDFSKPYNVVGDPPKVIATRNDNPFAFQQDRYTIRVYVDNNRGFSTAEKEIPLDNVQVRLSLPQGMADADDVSRRVITRNISRVDPKQMRFVDFSVQALPTTFGIKQYSVEITPQTTSPRKIISGNIVVGSQPYLQIRNAANLVGVPWQFQNTSWAAILGDPTKPNPLRPDIDFQAFTWDSSMQQYVLQTSPQRGIGTWIISNKDVGFKALGGQPSQPPDLADGAPLILLRQGWNLIANPYSYPIQLGQLVGVSDSDPRNSYSYQELVDQGAISSSMAYWDEATQSYRFIGRPEDVMQPNTGYWINVVNAREVTLSFPPVFIPFIPAGTGGIRSVGDSLWSLNLVATNGRASDTVNTIGHVKTAQAVRRGTIAEPPLSPLPNAISAGFVSNRSRLAQMVTLPAAGRSFTWNIFTKQAGTTNLTWPEMNRVPTKYKLTLVDGDTGARVNMRTTSRYSYAAKAQSAKEFKILVDVEGATVLENVTASHTSGRSNEPAQVGYTLAEPARTSVRITQNGRLIRVLHTDRNDNEGRHTALWNLMDSRGMRVRRGAYNAEVTASNGGPRESKVVSFMVR